MTKKGVDGHYETEKRDMLQFSFILAGQSVCCTICANVSRHRRRHIYIYFFDSVQPPARIVRAACIVHFLFATHLGLAALLRPDGFVSRAVCFVRGTLARPIFLGFQIGIPRCKCHKTTQKGCSRVSRNRINKKIFCSSYPYL